MGQVTVYRTDAEKDEEGGFGYTENGLVSSPGFRWNTNLGFNEAQDDRHPVVNVSWNDAVSFCEWLSKTEGVKYRLPTEAEWEFACRAGSQRRFSFGNNEHELGGYAWEHGGLRGIKGTKPVGQKSANAMGLFDLHGNVWEWCGDSFCPYTITDAFDPYGEGDDRHRVLRGGAFNSTGDQLRSAMRHKYLPHIRYDSIGFRIVRTFEKYRPKTPDADAVVPDAGDASKLESTKTLDSDTRLRDSTTLKNDKKLVDPE